MTREEAEAGSKSRHPANGPRGPVLRIVPTHLVKVEHFTDGMALACVECVWRRHLTIPDIRQTTHDQYADLCREAQVLKAHHEGTK